MKRYALAAFQTVVAPQRIGPAKFRLFRTLENSQFPERTDWYFGDDIATIERELDCSLITFDLREDAVKYLHGTAGQLFSSSRSQVDTIQVGDRLIIAVSDGYGYQFLWEAFVEEVSSSPAS